MRNCLVLLGSLLAAAAWLVSPPLASAQAQETRRAKPAPRLPDGKPDLSGVWSRKGSPSRHFGENYARDAMRPEAREKYKDQMAAGTIRTIQRDLYDPYIRACAPVGIPRLITEGGGRGRPFEIFHLPNRFFFHYEWGSISRQVWMDGRSHPDFSVTPTTYMGHSIGRWDGDTLVVDSVGFNDLTWMDTYGTPHTESLHMTERYRRLDLDTMEVQFTFEDPEIYTKPLVGNKMTLGRIPNGEIQEWVICDDRIRAMNQTDVCKITGAWEYEAYCNRREKGLPMDDLFNNRGGPDGYRGPEERTE